MNKHKKILCIIETLAKGGGAEFLLSKIIPELKKLGHEIEILTLYEATPSYIEELQKSGLNVTELRIPTNSGFLKKCIILRKKIKIVSPDIIWSHLYLSNILSSLVCFLSPKIILALTFHSYDHSNEASNKWHWLRTLIETFSFSRANYRIAVSQAVAGFFSKKYHMKFSAIPNGMDVDIQSICDFYEKLPNEFLLLSGRFVPEKGHTFALKALAILKNRNFIMPAVGFGHGPLQTQLIAQAKELEIPFFSFNRQSQEQSLALQKQAKLVVFSSTREGFGISLLESILLCRPIVATKIPAFLEITDSSPAIAWVEPENPQSLADGIMAAIQNIENNIDKREILAQKIAQKYSLEACVKNWNKFFQNLY